MTRTRVYIIYRLSERRKNSRVMYWTGKTWTEQMAEAYQYDKKENALSQIKSAFRTITNSNNPPCVVPIYKEDVPGSVETGLDNRSLMNKNSHVRVGQQSDRKLSIRGNGAKVQKGVNSMGPSDSDRKSTVKG